MRAQNLAILCKRKGVIRPNGGRECSQYIEKGGGLVFEGERKRESAKMKKEIPTLNTALQKSISKRRVATAKDFSILGSWKGGNNCSALYIGGQGR